MLPCVTVCCSVSKCVSERYNLLHSALRHVHAPVLPCCCSVLPCVAVCCSVLHCVALCCSVLQCVAVCCSLYTCPSAKVQLSSVSPYKLVYMCVRHVYLCVCMRAPMIFVCVQHTTTQCTTLARTHTTLQRRVTQYNALQNTATHCKTLQDTAIHCETLQHTATH